MQIVSFQKNHWIVNIDALLCMNKFNDVDGKMELILPPLYTTE